MRMTRLSYAIASCALAACATQPTENPRARTRQLDTVMQCGSADNPQGVDVYSGTGTVDWTAFRGSGYSFAFIKATQGTYDTQSTFQAQWSGALAAGVLRSPYHFFDATDDGVAQANAFLAELGSAGGLQIGDLPPLLDLECPTASTAASSEASCEYSGSSGFELPATVLSRAEDWLTTVKAATGMTPIIYSYYSWFGDTTVNDPSLADYPLFIASYNPCASIPAPWTSATFWQYSDDATITGVGGGADADSFFGSAGDLLAMTKQPNTPPPVDAGISDVDAAGGSGSGSGNGEAPSQHGGCQSSTAPSPWWLVGFAAVVVGIRLQRPRRKQKPKPRRRSR